MNKRREIWKSKLPFYLAVVASFSLSNCRSYIHHESDSFGVEWTLLKLMIFKYGWICPFNLDLNIQASSSELWVVAPVANSKMDGCEVLTNGKLVYGLY